MTDIIERLKEPETHYPGNFDTPKRANAMLSCLCQEAAEEIEHLRQQIAARSQPGADHGLTVAQAAHVAKVDPNHRLEMADLLRRGVAVGIGPQRECGPDVPPVAIWVVENPEFWIDCRETVAAAKSYAASLGLPVVHTSAAEDVG